MGTDEKPIPPSEWQVIVANVPLVSVDLIVEHEGGVLLGERKNEPAKSTWFVPGGTVEKNESLTEAVHRIAKEELGESVDIDERLGTYEHFYDTSEIEGIDSKHYVATAYRCHFECDDFAIDADEQHSTFEVFRPPFGEFHPYVERYLEML